MHKFLTALLICVPQFIIAPGLFENASGTPRFIIISMAVMFLLARDGKRPLVLLPIWTFVAVAVISSWFAADRWVAFAGFYEAPYYGVMPILLATLAYFAGSRISRPYEMLMWTGAALSVVAIAQAVAGKSFMGFELMQGRASGFRGSPVFFAMALIPCSLVSWVFIFGIFAAKAHGAMAALAAGVWIIAGGRARWIGPVSITLAIWAYLLAGYEPERLELIKIACRAFMAHPWLGWGPDNFIFAFSKHMTPEYIAAVGGNSLGQSSAHNDIAQVAATMGLAGLAAYFWLAWSLVKASINKPMALALLVAAWIQAQVNPIPTDIMVMFAALVGYEHSKEDFSATYTTGDALSLVNAETCEGDKS